MTFQPIVIGGGLSGWQFLKATQARQQISFESSARLTRDAEHFRNNINNITTAEQLVEDRQLLRVALSAFGLEADIDNRFFIKTILQQGTTDPTALANRLTDERYKSLAKTFGFDGLFRPRTQNSSFADEVLAKFRTQSFQVAVGQANESFRLALNFETGLEEVATASSSADSAWFRVMGTPPLRKVLETALALPTGFGQLDIDKQLDVFRDKMQARFGVSEIAEIADPEVTEKVVRNFLLQTELQQSANTLPSAVALTLVKAIPRASLFDSFG